MVQNKQKNNHRTKIRDGWKNTLKVKARAAQRSGV
jgi:hypothetical protein